MPTCPNSKLAFIDVETYSEVDLVKYGLTPYINHASFKILCGCIKLCNGETIMFDSHIPEENRKSLRRCLKRLKQKGYTFVAHNASFEDRILNLENFICTALMSRMIGGVSSLKSCAETYLSKKDRKDSQGYKDTFLLADDGEKYKDSETFKRLINYCEQDVILTMRLYYKLRDLYERTA